MDKAKQDAIAALTALASALYADWELSDAIIVDAMIMQISEMGAGDEPALQDAA